MHQLDARASRENAAVPGILVRAGTAAGYSSNSSNLPVVNATFVDRGPAGTWTNRLSGGPFRAKSSLLIDAFEALPPAERQEFAVEVLRRTRELPFDSGPVTDEEIGEAGRALFSFLDPILFT